MYLNRNLTDDQLRAQYLRIVEGEALFSAVDPSDRAPSDALSDQYDGGEAETEYLISRFGQPPWSFLKPDDPVPPRLARNGRLTRRTVRNPQLTEWNRMRQGHRNYNANPHRAQFITTADPKNTHELWLPGSGEMKRETALDVLIDLQARSQEEQLEFDYRRKRSSTVDHVEVGQNLPLYLPDKRNGPVFIAEIVVDEVRIAPRAQSGKVIGRLR